MLIYSLVKAWNWLLLLRGVGVRRPNQFRGVLLCYMSGGLLGSVIPSTAGTDAVRALLSHRRFGGELTAHVGVCRGAQCDQFAGRLQFWGCSQSR